MQENSSQQTPPIYSQNLKTKGQMYFFDVKAAKNGHKYLSIGQSWIKDGMGHRGNVTVFQNDLQEFLKALNEAQEKVSV
ncbi:MAG: DUF3276 family protein [Candidatus Doudnabacteria bacterium]|nr:DUF3276 family protein [Candidatus Doudnabacteria bacterium]